MCMSSLGCAIMGRDLMRPGRESAESCERVNINEGLQ
jgi:hypothetical protein